MLVLVLMCQKKLATWALFVFFRNMLVIRAGWYWSVNFHLVVVIS